MNIKKILFALIALFAISAAVNACEGAVGQKNAKISVVCTIFPQYDWTLQILGDKADDMDVTLLLNNRIDLHSYQPSIEDIAKISGCDLFIYIGGESDAWVVDAIKNPAGKNARFLNLLDVLGEAAKEEEFLEGMETEEDETDKNEYDEHIWLSIKNAQLFCTEIANSLASLDAANAKEYKNNLNAYLSKLQNLDMEYQTALNAASHDTLLFCDRFPFRYLTDDYGLTVYAAFSGCSAETEAGFETIVFLANKLDELGLDAVMVTESGDQSIAKTVIGNTAKKNQRILVLDSMQSVAKVDLQNGVNYLFIMESNLEALKKALK